MTPSPHVSPVLGLLHRLERRRARAALFGRNDDGPAPGAGRFELLQVLGRGASGIVFKARDPGLAREVAIKVMDASAHGDVADEARLLAAISDPNVVPVFEVGTQAGVTFVVMEYVEGTTLQRWLTDGPSVAEIRDAFVDAARGLAACHRRGVVHGDFKPANVMIGKDGRARVVDFGLALRTDHAAGPTGGTPSYMAPELGTGAPPSPASDVYSFGMALYRALGGQVWPDGAIDAATIRPRSLRRIVQDALRSRPEDRPKDADVLVARLQAAARPSRLWIWVAAATLAVVLVGAAWTTRSTEDPRFEGVPTQIFRSGAPTVLWVDDNPRYNAEEIAELHRRGYNVRLAVSVEEADRHGDYRDYVLVISDLERHDESGFDPDAGFRVIRRVRADSGSVPIVVYTNDRLVPVLTASVAEAGGAAITGNRAELLRLVSRLARRSDP